MIIEVIVFHIADRLVENPPPVGFMSSHPKSPGRHLASIDCWRVLAAGFDGGLGLGSTRRERTCLRQFKSLPSFAAAHDLG
jgi:hypothetical protein